MVGIMFFCSTAWTVNEINLLKYNMPWELEQEIAGFIDYYNNKRYPEPLDNFTLANVYCGRREEILTRRDRIRENTLRARKRSNLSRTTTRRPSLSKTADLSA